MYVLLVSYAFFMLELLAETIIQIVISFLIYEDSKISLFILKIEFNLSLFYVRIIIFEKYVVV